MANQGNFVVNSPGVLSLIQDNGRYGAFELGLTNGGPVDKTAFQWANRLCGNDLTASTIEVSIGGLTLTAHVESKIAVTGATMPLRINGQVKSLWQSYHVKPGDVIELGFASAGLRSYLAIAGGFNIPAMFGSTATVCREHVGGIHGGQLNAGDILNCQLTNYSTITKHNQLLEEKYWPNYGNEVVLHTIPSYQQRHFSSHQQRLFYSSEYRVSKSCDRMGYRLEGRAIASDISGILSEGICHGAIQIPADGQPIVLLNDRQTIGGYPKIGAVISSDTAQLGQLTTGAKVHFEPISMDKAHNLYQLAASQFARTPLSQCD